MNDLKKIITLSEKYHSYKRFCKGKDNVAKEYKQLEDKNEILKVLFFTNGEIEVPVIRAYKQEKFEKFYKLMKKVPKKENYKWSKSPYGMSFYYHHKNEKIDWGVKPKNSYRVSNHWNWENWGTHCPVEEGVAINNLELRKFDGKVYKKVI